MLFVVLPVYEWFIRCLVVENEPFCSAWFWAYLDLDAREKYVLMVFLTAEEGSGVQALVQPNLAAVLWVCLKSGLRSTGTSSNLFSLCTAHSHVLHLDLCQTGAVVQGAAQFLLQTASVTYPGKRVEGDFMDWPRGSLVAQLKYKNINWSAG